MSPLSFHLADRVVERVAEVAALTVPGCIALDAKLAGLAGRSFPRVSTQVEKRAGTASFEVEIATTYPCPIADVTEAVRNAISSHIRSLTGLEVTRVTVRVANVSGSETRGRITASDVANQSVEIVPSPIRVRSSSAKLAAIEVAPPMALAPIRVTAQRKPLNQAHLLTSPRELASVKVPAPRALRSVHPPAPRAVQESFPLPAQVPLAKVQVPSFTKVPVSTPPPPRVRSVAPPAPGVVFAAKAPAPQPLRRITINPVRRRYDAAH